MADLTDGGTVIQEQRSPKLVDFSQILQLTDTDNFIQDMFHYLNNERLNEKQEWVKPYRVYIDEKGNKIKVEIPGIMNEYGISKMLNKVSSIINRNMSTGNLDKQGKMYRSIMGRIARVINNDITINMRNYNLQPEDVPWVKDLIINPIEIYLTKGLGDGERNHLFGSKSGLFNIQKYLSPKGESKELYN